MSSGSIWVRINENQVKSDLWFSGQMDRASAAKTID